MRLVTFFFAAAVVAAPAGAQSLASRVAAQDGDVSFHFAARPGVCGDGDHMVRLGAHVYMGRWNGDNSPEECFAGPVQLRLSVDSGAVRRVEMWVGPLRSRGGRDLGAVPAAEGARYLLQLAADEGAARGNRIADPAITAAILADSAIVWPQLLAIARAREGHGGGGGSNARFWLSRLAAAKLAGHPDDLGAADDGNGDGVKAQAIFALSQRPHGEGIAPLIEIARTNADPGLRSRALFWLGQSGDARALDLFESVLRK